MSERLFYIASSSKFVSQCKILANSLETNFNVKITRKWWIDYLKDAPDFANKSDLEFYYHPQVQAIREFDFEAIRKADYVIIYNEGGYKLTGALVELGYATALKKPIFVIGKMKRSVMISHCAFFDDIPQFLDIMKRGQFKKIEVFA